MHVTPLPYNSPLAQYDEQAQMLLESWRAGDADAIQVFKQKHPRFLREDVPWLPKPLSDDDIRHAELDVDDARLATARAYDFRDWARLSEHVEAMQDPLSPVARFEAAVEAVVDGDLALLRTTINHDPALVEMRSSRVTHFDPPIHRATLLHYVAANGVEGHRQRTPANAANVARLLLEAGSDVDALATMYGGACTTMSMLVSSTPPARAGVQVALVDVLLDHGASVKARGAGNWTSPLMTALVFGFLDAAQALERRGARVDTLPSAAGLGRMDDVARLLPSAEAGDRQRAFALAAQLGHVDVVRVLLDAGAEPNRYNPPGFHAHATPLHQAIAAGHLDVVRLLVERGARLDVKDTLFEATPMGWADYLGQRAIADYLGDYLGGQV